MNTKNIHLAALITKPEFEFILSLLKTGEMFGSITLRRGSAVLYHERNVLMTNFLVNGGSSEFLLMVDDDVSWTEEDVLSLAKVKRSNRIVGLPYLKRSVRPETTYLPIEEDNQFHNCVFVGFGFTLIPHAVLGRLAKHCTTYQDENGDCFYNFCTPIEGTPTLRTEDQHFCQRVSALEDVKISVLQNEFVTHFGTFPYHPNTFHYINSSIEERKAYEARTNQN